MVPSAPELSVRRVWYVFWLWRAVDQHDVVLDILVQERTYGRRG
jgi:transposase-like protein